MKQSIPLCWHQIARSGLGIISLSASALPERDADDGSGVSCTRICVQAICVVNAHSAFVVVSCGSGSVTDVFPRPGHLATGLVGNTFKFPP